MQVEFSRKLVAELTVWCSGVTSRLNGGPNKDPLTLSISRYQCCSRVLRVVHNWVPVMSGVKGGESVNMQYKYGYKYGGNINIYSLYIYIPLNMEGNINMDGRVW